MNWPVPVRYHASLGTRHESARRFQYPPSLQILHSLPSEMLPLYKFARINSLAELYVGLVAPTLAPGIP